MAWMPVPENCLKAVVFDHNYEVASSKINLHKGVQEKTCLWSCQQVTQKQVCDTPEFGLRVEILDKET